MAMSGKHGWIALVLWGICRTAAAQGFEVGAGISRGCTGDSSGFCSGQTGPMWAVHGGYWISDHVQIAVRFAALPLDDFTYSTHRDDRFNVADDAAARSLTRLDITSRNRSRQVWGGELLYYFAGARRFGFVLGAGLGELSNRSVQSCAPTGCERVLAAVGSQLGRSVGTAGNLTGIFGLSGPAGRRVRFAGGVRLHNFAGENNSTTEVFLTAGMRF
jgi:hypothetical protein